jgi:hypothetical protein
MSHYGIPVDRSCGSFRPGHQVHWIHAKKASEKDQSLIDVSIVFHGDGWVDLEADDFTLKLWNHSATLLRQAWDRYGRAVWKPRWHMLSLPGPTGVAFNMATWQGRTPCVEKVAPPAELQTTVDRVLWEARQYGGYTVPLSSLRPGDEVEIARELQRDEMRHRGGSVRVGRR